MTRKLPFACLLGIFSAFLSIAQNTSAPPDHGKIAQQPGAAGQQQPPDENAPPEEDEAIKPKLYPFDPLEAARNIKVGIFYMRQRKTSGYRAAAGRFEDATKYDPKSAEAFFRLGEAEEKLQNTDKAKAAFQRVLEVAPDSKLAKEARKKLPRT